MEPTNKHYYVAVNADGSYPLTRESQSKDGVVTPYVQSGKITTAHVVPDGQVIPDSDDE